MLELTVNLKASIKNYQKMMKGAKNKFEEKIIKSTLDTLQEQLDQLEKNPKSPHSKPKRDPKIQIKNEDSKILKRSLLEKNQS